MIYLISDTHFCHKNILTYENRPFTDLVDMREKLISNWNSVIGPDDEVYHLGDVGFFNKELGMSIVSRLNGHKHLILGNHDGHSKSWFKDIGFETVEKHELLEVNGVKILLTHYPHSQPLPKEGYDLHFYGHVHGKGNEPGLYPTLALNGACLCVERWNYLPVEINKVIDGCKHASSHFNEVNEIYEFE